MPKFYLRTLGPSGAEHYEIWEEELDSMCYQFSDLKDAKTKLRDLKRKEEIDTYGESLDASPASSGNPGFGGGTVAVPKRESAAPEKSGTGKKSSPGRKSGAS